eukprot:CAMPEP_0117426396 /NCGR_PEP_ID=MMETSP0758-20121206/6526_1 /TAXON_ID=63605 /ORGANISM="Percolomonas cosmopolitus, Strain AE-1 (ATCC 50343)" /LENGTH=620 /DNA_ID=CAMNT_0005211555 /DNA_START=30 /DNA_END=1889 /DNA_ORIENTATION=+
MSTILQKAYPHRLIPDEVEAIIPYSSIDDLSSTYTTGKTLLFEKGVMVLIPLHRKTNIPHLIAHVKRMNPSLLKKGQTKKKRGDNTLSLVNKKTLKALTGYLPGEISPFLIHDPLKRQNFSLSQIIIDNRVVDRGHSSLKCVSHPKNSFEFMNNTTRQFMRQQEGRHDDPQDVLKKSDGKTKVVIGSGKADDAFVISIQSLLPGLKKRYPNVPISILDITSPECPSIDLHIYDINQSYHVCLPEKHTFSFVLSMLALEQQELFDTHMLIQHLNTRLSDHAQQYKSTSQSISTRQCLILHTKPLHEMVKRLCTLSHPLTTSFAIQPCTKSAFALFSRYMQFKSLYWRSLDASNVLIEPYVKFHVMDIPEGITMVLENFLYLGSMKDFNDARRKFDHVICLASNSSYLESASYHFYPMRDTRTEQLKDMIDRVLPLLDTIRKAKQTVFIHSVKGMSRSVAIVIAYLMKYHHFLAEDAYIALKRKRHFVLPNPGFIRQLTSLETSLKVHPPLNHQQVSSTDLPLIFQSDTQLAPFSSISSLSLSMNQKKAKKVKKKKPLSSANEAFLDACQARLSSTPIFQNHQCDSFSSFCSSYQAELDDLFQSIPQHQDLSLKPQSTFSKR